DLGDIPAFELVRALPDRGMIGIGVYAASAEEQALLELADVSVPGPAGIARWLDELADAIEGSRPH
ncbi:MAG: trehalose-phosphatase, partial [Brooklawnia sp.]